MRYLGAAAVFVFALSTGFLQRGPVSAATLSVSGEITITARVADTHYVVIDNHDNVLEIISNTTRPAAPKVFRGSTNSDERPLTEGVYEQYLRLTETNQGVMGTLYKKETRIADSERRPYLLLLPGNVLGIARYFH
jgi:hypothetical protein